MGILHPGGYYLIVYQIINGKRVQVHTALSAIPNSKKLWNTKGALIIHLHDMKWGYLQIFFMPCRVNIHILLQKYQYVWLRGAITHLAGGISEVTQSCLTLCDPSPPGSSIHGIFQARVLEWVAISCSSLQFKGSRFQNTPGTKCRVRNYEPEQSWKQKSRTQGWGWGLRAEDTNVRTVSAKVTLWALSVKGTTKGEVAKHQPWDAPSFEGYAKKTDFYPKFTEVDSESH